jgi:DNA (cytosine-5)-methyltransferase 1
MKLLDLFCGSGGASVGYAQAGFDVTGIDISNHKDYPYTFIKADVMELDAAYLSTFDVIHASPPCQVFSATRHLAKAQGKVSNKPDLVEPTRQMLIKSNRSYVIENVIGAPLLDPVMLCGSAFNLKVRRHRLFENNLKLVGTVCDHKKQGRPVGVYGSLRDQIPNGGKTADSIEHAREAMGLDYMNWSNIVEAIPPAYTKYLGRQIANLYMV